MCYGVSDTEERGPFTIQPRSQGCSSRKFNSP
jgi:hypothetical protein